MAETPFQSFTSPMVGLQEEIRSLKSAIASLAGSVGGDQKQNVLFGPRGEIASSWNSEHQQKSFLDGLRDVFKPFTESVKTLTESNAKQAKTTGPGGSGYSFAALRQGAGYAMQGLEAVGSVYYEYGYQRPAQMVGGQAGRTLAGGMKRSEDVASTAGTVLQAAGMISMLIPGGQMLGAGLLGAGALAGSSWGKTASWGLTKGREMEAASREELAGSFTRNLGDWQENFKQRIRIGEVALGGQATGKAATYGNILETAKTLGLHPAEMAEFFAVALKVGGAKGFAAIDEKVITEKVAKGIYGTGPEVFAAVATAGRLGFGKDDLFRYSRQTGFQAPEVAAAMQQTKVATLFMGKEITDKMTDAVMRSTMASEINPTFAAQKTAGILGGAAQAGMGNEAIAMLQLSAYRKMNPGTSMVDFLTSQNAGFVDEEGRRMVGEVAARGAAGGKWGKLLASAQTGGQVTALGMANYSTDQNDRPDLMKEPEKVAEKGPRASLGAWYAGLFRVATGISDSLMAQKYKDGSSMMDVLITNMTNAATSSKTFGDKVLDLHTATKAFVEGPFEALLNGMSRGSKLTDEEIDALTSGNVGG